MAHRYHEIAFTQAVKAHQEALGSRSSYARMEAGPDQGDRLTARETGFIAARDSFYIASTGAEGWPYLQHRGGPRGFVKVLDDRTLGFADFSGNRQYITLGNLDGDDRVSLFFMDYPNRRRLKLYGHARALSPKDDAPALARLALPDCRARVERGIAIRVAALDWNCPQHITPRFSADELEALAAAQGADPGH